MANLRVGRRSGLVLRGGRQRRQTRWIGMTPTFTTLGAATPVLFAGFDAASLALRPFTIVRLRGWFSAVSDQTIANERYNVAFGLAVVSEQALAIGVTAVPTPEADRESDLWFLYEELGGGIQAVTSTGLSEAHLSMKLDSRAMRKVEDGQDIATVFETTFAGCIAYKGGRMLVKLH